MTTTQINSNYLIRYYPVFSIRGNWGNGRRGDRLLSANTAISEFGAKEFKGMLNIAKRSKKDKTIIRSRTGSEICFICR